MGIKKYSKFLEIDSPLFCQYVSYASALESVLPHIVLHHMSKAYVGCFQRATSCPKTILPLRQPPHVTSRPYRPFLRTDHFCRVKRRKYPPCFPKIYLFVHFILYYIIYIRNGIGYKQIYNNVLNHKLYSHSGG
jgi:hypothetical protein